MDRECWRILGRRAAGLNSMNCTLRNSADQFFWSHSENLLSFPQFEEGSSLVNKFLCDSDCTTTTPTITDSLPGCFLPTYIHFFVYFHSAFKSVKC